MGLAGAPAAEAPLAGALLGGGAPTGRKGAQRAGKALKAAFASLALGVAGGIALALAAGRPGVRAARRAEEGSLLAGLGEPLAWTPEQPAPWEGAAFETRVEFHMPYMGFVEDIYVHSDEPRGLMRLSYYSGADVFLINTTGRSYELVPVAERESCLVTQDVRHVELVVPDLDLFVKKGTHREVALLDANGVESTGFEFTLNLSSVTLSDDGQWDHYQPVSGFEGVYKLFVNASAGGAPLNVSFIGHNAFFVQSHADHYQIIYKHFLLRPEGIDELNFMPPQGMYCQSYINPTGPFKQGPLTHNIAIAMPGMRGDSARRSVVRDIWTHLRTGCGEDCSERQRQALRRYRWVQAANRRGGSYRLGSNHMLDWTDQELGAVLGRRAVQLSATFTNACRVWMPKIEKNMSDHEDWPAQLDWRERGVVGPPRDQGTCGSCWAFATVGMLEGQVAKMYGSLIRLSEQHLLDCSWSYGNLACDGGSDWAAMSWALQRNGGQVATEASYGRYLSENGFCHFDMSRGIRGLDGVAVPPPGARYFVDSGVEIESCWVLPGPNVGGEKGAIEVLTVALVVHGPISVSIEASRMDFYYYASGIYDNPACSSSEAASDHVVLAVGYGRGALPGQTYWLLRNSWSSYWGEGGYVRVAREGNICGVATTPAFALLNPHARLP
mmetsp:Transcript_63347/g.177158  ORF Transcript_63347/g.177158 Transcript_63347/m.177158 type:complete len:668 (+) Transcript_63347:2-2005(+)